MKPSARETAVIRATIRLSCAIIMCGGLINIMAGIGCSKRDENAQAGGASAAPSALDSLITAPSQPSGMPASQSAGASARATPPGDTPESMMLQGTWEGTYKAKKGSVGMPGNVKDKARTREDGATAVGPGTVTITIAADGELTGKADGALGEATLRGKVEGEMIRASVFPDNPSAPTAMTGVLVGMLKDGVIQAEIRVAGPDATVVRESAIDLKRK